MWHESHRFDTPSRLIADRHYNRQKPGTPQFVPPGRCLVLRSADELSLWVTSWPFAEFTKHGWAGAWVNSCFRREGGSLLASDMIRLAVAATQSKWPDTPALGMITFVDASKVERKRQPGRCYLKAGFSHVGFTKGGLHAFQLLPADMPDPIAARPPHGSFQFTDDVDRLLASHPGGEP